MSEVYTRTGRLADGRTVVLDQPLALPPGRVRVVVESIPEEPAHEGWLAALNEIRQSLRESGYRFRSKEEIDAQVRAERAGWEQ
jgi:hypothetical protein